MKSTKGIAQLLIMVAIAILGLVAVPVVANIEEVNAPTESSTPTSTPTESPVPTDTPSETPTLSPSPETINTSGTYSHIHVETNGVVHDETVNGSGSYNYEDQNTSIHINNN